MFASAMVLACLPAALVSWSGFVHGVELLFARNLQIESVGAMVVAWVQRAAGSLIEAVRAFGARDIVAGSSRLLASVCRLLLLVMVVLGALLTWRRVRERPADSKTLLIDGVATTVAGIWIASPVLSPQYLVWGLPVLLFVSSPTARLSYLCALAVTRIEYPACYPFISHLGLPGLLIVTVRNFLLIATWAALVRNLIRPRAHLPGEV